MIRKLFVIIFFTLVVVIGYSQDNQNEMVRKKHPLEHLKDGQEVNVEGSFRIVGNEPFTMVAFMTSGGNYYIPKELNSKYRSKEYRGKKFLIKGNIQRKVLRTPNGIEILRIYLTPSSVTEIK